MSFALNYSQEETFRLLADYFNGRRMKMLSSIPPSNIRAEVGSWVSMTRGNAIGEIETNIVKRNGGSYVHFNFNFTKEHVGNFILSLIGAVMIYFLVTYLVNTMVAGRLSGNELSQFWAIFNPFIILSCTLEIALVMIMSGRNVSLTRRRFTQEFTAFTQTLSTQTIPPPPPARS